MGFIIFCKYCVNSSNLKGNLLRLFWGDAHLNEIGWMDLDDGSFRRHRINAKRTSHVSSMTLFEDFVYWSDWKLRQVIKRLWYCDGERGCANGEDEPGKEICVDRICGVGELLDFSVAHKRRLSKNLNQLLPKNNSSSSRDSSLDLR